jgi:hypothetical protein
MDIVVVAGESFASFPAGKPRHTASPPSGNSQLTNASTGCGYSATVAIERAAPTA